MHFNCDGTDKRNVHQGCICSMHFNCFATKKINLRWVTVAFVQCTSTALLQNKGKCPMTVWLHLLDALKLLCHSKNWYYDSECSVASIRCTLTVLQRTVYPIRRKITILIESIRRTSTVITNCDTVLPSNTLEHIYGDDFNNQFKDRQ